YDGPHGRRRKGAAPPHVAGAPGASLSVPGRDRGRAGKCDSSGFAGEGSAMTQRARIIGAGRYLPERILTNDDLAEFVDTSDEWIVERTGIRERRVAGPEETTSTLAIEAARRALASAEADARDIDLIVT